MLFTSAALDFALAALLWALSPSWAEGGVWNHFFALWQGGGLGLFLLPESLPLGLGALRLLHRVFKYKTFFKNFWGN